MKIVPNESDREWIVLSLGSDEALILFQPGQMIRAVLETDPKWRECARFLTDPGDGAGMLAVLPRTMGPAILAASARHPLERQLKEILFDLLEADERPPFDRVPEVRQPISLSLPIPSQPLPSESEGIQSIGDH